MTLFKHLAIIAGLIICSTNCSTNGAKVSADLSQHMFTWDNATVYFLMTDRFYDGDANNNFEHTEDNPPAPYRGYMGGDLKGITQKINDGYFSNLLSNIHENRKNCRSLHQLIL